MSLENIVDAIDDLIRDQLIKLRHGRFFIDSNNEIIIDKNKSVIDLKNFLLEIGYGFYCSDEYGDSIQVDPLVIGNDKEMQKIEEMQKIRQTCLKFFKDNGGFDFIKNNNLYYYKNTNTIEEERKSPQINEETKIELHMEIEIKALLFEIGIILVIEEEWIDFRPILPSTKVNTVSNIDNIQVPNNILSRIKSIFSSLCIIYQNDKYFETDSSQNIFVNSNGMITLNSEDDGCKNITFSEYIKKFPATLSTSDLDFQNRMALIDQFVVIKQ